MDQLREGNEILEGMRVGSRRRRSQRSGRLDILPERQCCTPRLEGTLAYLVEIVLWVEEHLGKPIPLFTKVLAVAIWELVQRLGEISGGCKVESLVIDNLTTRLLPPFHYLILRP